MSLPMEEEWRPVLGYEGYYEVSSLGRVRSLHRSPTRILRQSINRGGYPTIALWKGAMGTSYMVHRLVNTAFHSTPADGLHTRHLDGNRLNNRADNLAWGTRSENMQDAIRHGTNRRASSTHCPNGHEYTAENTRWTADGRSCRICRTASIARNAKPLKPHKPPITHCKRGHEFTPENTRLHDGRRICRSCQAARSAQWYQARKRAAS